MGLASDVVVGLKGLPGPDGPGCMGMQPLYRAAPANDTLHSPAFAGEVDSVHVAPQAKTLRDKYGE